MKYLPQEEIESLAKAYVELREKAQSGNSEDEQQFKDIQNLCIVKFRCLVAVRTNRYKRFSNFEDLEQDGFEALLAALKTYRPEKGSFSWWADKYISTRISRAANAHTTIRYPMHQARLVKPQRMPMPVLYADSAPSDRLEKEQNDNFLNEVINELPEQHRKIVKMLFGIKGRINNKKRIIKRLSISEEEVDKILEEAKSYIKGELEYEF